MVINENVFHFAARSLETCLAGSCNPGPGTTAGSDPTKVPLHLIDLQSAVTDIQDPQILNVVHRTQIPNLCAVEWATLSYARGQIAPRRPPEGLIQAINNGVGVGVLLDVIYDDARTRVLVPQYLLEDAVRIVKELGIRYLWIDEVCPLWDPHDGGEWVKSYVNTFQGAKINIQLPDCDDMERRNEEHLRCLVKEDVKWMEEQGNWVFNSIFRGDDPPQTPPTLRTSAAPFLVPFFTDPCELIDRLLSPRKLFCLHDGDAIWACAHHCTHSRYEQTGRLHVDPRECLLNPPKFTPSRLPPRASSSSLPSTRQPQKERGGPPVRSTKQARQAWKGTSKDKSRITGVKKSRHKSPSLLTQVLTRRAFRGDVASGPCSKSPRERKHKPPFSAMIEALSRCRNLRRDEDPFIGFQLLVYIYIHDLVESMPAPYLWDRFLGHIPDELLWYGDVEPSLLPEVETLSGSCTVDYWTCDYKMSWLHSLGPRAFLSSHWSFTGPLTSRCGTTLAKTTPRGRHRLFDLLGKQPRGFEIKCARYNEPIVGVASPEDPDPEADCLFAALREASVTGRPTFLGAGLDEPRNHDLPCTTGSQPCYIYNQRGDLMGRGIVDKPLWFLEERVEIEAGEEQEISENHRRCGRKGLSKPRNRRIVTLAFIGRESLELSALDMLLLLPLPLPWETEPLSCTSATCAEHGRGRAKGWLWRSIMD
ncbi:HET-domain-containing protein [Apiospora saccharicola]|uniref:HET-domain-containing protein n=1 Tax=Apiospora saccharicola TaxID=335842 RepID=A0ABR1UYD5_9PEZI